MPPGGAAGGRGGGAGFCARGGGPYRGNGGPPAPNIGGKGGRLSGRVFLPEPFVRPGNGPASRRLAEAVRRELLPEEPYRSYGIGFDDFFSDPSPRMKDDLGALAIRLDGWESDERLLREVGIEAVRAHPGPYARGVARTVWDLLRLSVFRPLGSGGSEGGGPTVTSGGSTLPEPTEGERIPSAHESGPTTPDRSIYTVWTSPTEHHLVFVHAGDEERYEALHRRIDALQRSLPAQVWDVHGSELPAAPPAPPPAPQSADVAEWASRAALFARMASRKYPSGNPPPDVKNGLAQGWERVRCCISASR